MENVRLHQYVARLTFESSRHQMIGSSPGMQRVTQLIKKVAPTDSTVLIRGDTGTGKELVARALHYNSPRQKRALVTVNCAALQETLLESELFGHEKGSFTGATQAKHGLIEVAEGGTLFIDEIAEMPPAMQAKLLRVLEDGHYPARGQHAGAARRRAHRRRHQQAPGGGAEGGPFPRGSLSIASTWSPSCCRPCANAVRTFRC